MREGRRGKAGAFSHLHVRSGFSYGLGVATPEEIVGAAAGTGMSTIALTDRDGMHGIPRFLRAADEAKISGVVGAEITVELRKGGGERPFRGHVVLLTDSASGYRTLCRLLTAYRTSSEDRRRPACPLPLLLEHASRPGSGLVCLTGAIPFGLLGRLLFSPDTGHRGKCSEVVGLLREAFGPRNLYAELTDDRTAGSRRRLARVAAFARQHGIPTLAAGEVSYLSPTDHRLHEVLAAASALSALPGPDYRPTDRLHLRPIGETERLFASYPEALRNARLLAERCAGSVRLRGSLHMPAANLPEGESPEKKLLALALAGARRRYGDGGSREAGWVECGRLKSRLERELRCINALGFAGYFLVAHEAVTIAKEKGIPVTGRGSAANSLVSYCLGLTQPEPFSNRLLFERFMHEGRKDVPDVDLDTCSKRRDEIRDELICRYDKAGAAVAATANTLSLRGAVRTAARALGHAPDEIDGLSKGVPRRAGSWEEALEEPSMRGNPIREDPKGHALLMELSMGLRGRLWQAGTHLGGLVFGTPDAHLSELVPLEPSGKEGLLRCQYDKNDLEYCGIPKLDLLGLRTHTALAEAGALVGRKLGRKVDPLSPPPDDRETYGLVRSSRNAGIFQLESPGQMNLSGRLRPRRFSDLVHQISLFRPGPVRGDLVTPYVRRRNAKEPYSVPLPELEEVLGPTYGILLFQEQVLEIANRVAGFTLAEGDGLRRAMTKDRGPGAMKELKGEFLRRAGARGVPPAKAEEVFSLMENFSVYGFSAAHAASFAEVSYASAYMKTHHPAEFFAGLLNNQPMAFYSPRVLLNEARRAGLRILPPDVRQCREGFGVEEDGRTLRVGLRYCRGISENAVRSILSEREERPFASAADLYRRTATSRDALENLVRAGFLDGLLPPGGRAARGPAADALNRQELLRQAASLPQKRRKTASSQPAQPELPLPHPCSWWQAREGRRPSLALPLHPSRGAGSRAGAATEAPERWERAILGLDVRRHPLAEPATREALKALGVRGSDELKRLPHGTRTRAAGLLECLQSPPTKSGHPVWFLVIEDEEGLLQTTIFRDVYERYGHLLHQEDALLLQGRVEHDPKRGFSFLVERVGSLRSALARTRRAATHGDPAGTPIEAASEHGDRRAV